MFPVPIDLNTRIDFPLIDGPGIVVGSFQMSETEDIYILVFQLQSHQDALEIDEL